MLWEMSAVNIGIMGGKDAKRFYERYAKKARTDEPGLAMHQMMSISVTLLELPDRTRSWIVDSANVIPLPPTINMAPE